MLDFSHGSGLKTTPPDFCDLVNDHIDRGIVERRSKEPKRGYLGASMLGDPCTRRIVYVGSGVEPDEQFSARTLRIFDIGHTSEDFLVGASEFDQVFVNAAARWFHDAGFDLRTRNSQRQQFGWETLGGRIQGHIDGVFLGGPAVEKLTYPALFETKALNKKNWNKVKKHGVRSHDAYYGQVNLNMAYLDVGQTVFTSVNKDTCELDHQLIEFDATMAQRLSDRAVEVVRMIDKGELPDRIASQPDYYICVACSMKRTCWK